MRVAVCPPVRVVFVTTRNPSSLRCAPPIRVDERETHHILREHADVVSALGFFGGRSASGFDGPRVRTSLTVHLSPWTGNASIWLRQMSYAEVPRVCECLGADIREFKHEIGIVGVDRPQPPGRQPLTSAGYPAGGSSEGSDRGVPACRKS